MQRFQRAERECAYCGKTFKPKRANAIYDSDACRAAARRKRRKTGRQTAKNTENDRKPTKNDEQSDETVDKTLKNVITRQIAQYGLSDHWRAAEAIALADSMDKPDTGAAKAALSRQLTALMEKLEALSKKHDDAVDEVIEHARQLREGEET